MTGPATVQRPFPLMVRLSYHERCNSVCKRETVRLRSPYENLRAKRIPNGGPLVGARARLTGGIG